MIFIRIPCFMLRTWNSLPNTYFIEEVQRTLRKKRFKQQYENILWVRRVFETINFLFVEYRISKDKQIYHLIKEKKNGKEWTFDPEVGLINDIDGGPSFKPELYFTRNKTEYLVIWINAFELKAHVESEAFKVFTPKYPEKKKELEQLAAKIDENDNPVLMLVKLKHSCQ